PENPRVFDFAHAQRKGKKSPGVTFAHRECRASRPCEGTACPCGLVKCESGAFSPSITGCGLYTPRREGTGAGLGSAPPGKRELDMLKWICAVALVAAVAEPALAQKPKENRPL